MAMENFMAPSRRGAVMKPDLAYVEAEENVPVNVCESSLVKQRPEVKAAARDIRCYRCDQPGHRAVGYLVRGSSVIAANVKVISLGHILIVQSIC